MWPDRVLNPGLLALKSDALPTPARGPAGCKAILIMYNPFDSMYNRGFAYFLENDEIIIKCTNDSCNYTYQNTENSNFYAFVKYFPLTFRKNGAVSLPMSHC